MWLARPCAHAPSRLSCRDDTFVVVVSDAGADVVAGRVPSMDPERTQGIGGTTVLQGVRMKSHQTRGLQAFRRVEAWFAEHPQVLAGAGSSAAALPNLGDGLRT